MLIVNFIILHLIYATNDCNVFRRQVQSAINEGRLTFPEMKIDKALIPVHTIDLNNAKVLIQPDQAEGAKDKNVIIGDDRSLTVDNKILAREVIQEKTPDGKKNLRIILKPRTLGGQEDSSSCDRSAAQQRPVRPVLRADQTALVVSPGRSSRNIRKWVYGRLISQKCRARLQIRSLLLANY